MSDFTAVAGVLVQEVYPDGSMLVFKDDWYQLMHEDFTYPLCKSNSEDKHGKPRHCFGTLYWSEDGNLCSYDISSHQTTKRKVEVPWRANAFGEFMKVGSQVLLKTYAACTHEVYFRRDDVGRWNFAFKSEKPAIWATNYVLAVSMFKYTVTWTVYDTLNFKVAATGVKSGALFGTPTGTLALGFKEVTGGFVVDTTLYKGDPNAPCKHCGEGTLVDCTDCDYCG